MADTKIKGLDKITKEDVFSEGDIYSAISRFQVDIVEQQDEMIRKTIETIGGKRFEHVTVDKHKVVEALEKTMPKRIKLENTTCLAITAECSVCGSFLRTGYNPVIIPKELVGGVEDLYRSWGGVCKYCPKCGQALDWTPILELTNKEGELDD